MRNVLHYKLTKSIVTLNNSNRLLKKKKIAIAKNCASKITLYCMFQHPLLDFHALLLKLLNQRVERSTNYSMDALMALIVFIQLSKYSAFQNSDVVTSEKGEKTPKSMNMNYKWV